MRRRFVSSLICGALAIGVLTSCGSDKAQGTGEFATVVATANTPGADVNSSVAVCGPPIVPNTTPDSATYTINSTVYGGSSTTILPSDLIIDKITLTLIPANTVTPALPLGFATQYPTSGQRVAPGGSVSIPVVVASSDLKNFLRTTVTPQALDCSAQGLVTTYTYRVKVSFEALEVNTNRVATITPPGYVNLIFTDQ
ncbi:hypothetical protein [Geomonas sp.]|uniref:hypothetical protein n=1 Tax=Geomonas sp. TaxID=2651584 RepID=UPI002B4836AC|nr:hypothetical protein [Geomonas sp.]HJV35812.1 hypothetical protein [Geomonas sp.]